MRLLDVPRSHPEGISASVRCLDEGTVDGVAIGQFANAPRLVREP